MMTGPSAHPAGQPTLAGRAAPCPHPVGRVVDPADHAAGTRCDSCGAVLPLNGIPLRAAS